MWNLKRPTAEVVRNQHRLGGRVITAPPRRSRKALPRAHRGRGRRGAGKQRPGGFARAPFQAQPFAPKEVFGEFNLPHIPTKAEIVGRARALLANSPSMEDIAAKANELLLEAVGARLATIAVQTAY